MFRMEEAAKSSVTVTRVEKVNGRCIVGICRYGQWRWQVELRGPCVRGVHMLIWRLAGDTLAEAEQLARELGPLPDTNETEY